MPKYSVIVPVYNVEKVLPRCIDSILNQTISDFELILVDDGSPDRSGEICDEYAARDSRVRVIHQQNGGVSRARNAGLDAAQGEYIVFVDSDDYVDRDYLEVFDLKQADLIVSGSRTHNASGECVDISTADEGCKAIITEEEKISVLREWFAMPVWAKCFNRSVIEEHQIRFDQEFCFAEDALFMAEYLLHANNLRCSSKVTYNYQQENPTSLMKLARIDHEKKCILLQEKIFEVYSGHEEIQRFLANKLFWIIENELARICNEPGIIKNLAKIRAVFCLDHVKRCLKRYGKDLPFITRLVFQVNIPLLVLFRYRRK